MLIHLQICEGLNKVVGKEFRKNLTIFEVEKMEEIDDYITAHSNIKCVKLMHEKLLYTTRFLRKEGKGVLPF